MQVFLRISRPAGDGLDKGVCDWASARELRLDDMEVVAAAGGS